MAQRRKCGDGVEAAAAADLDVITPVLGVAEPPATDQRLGHPGVWVAGRALLLTLVVLLAITFDHGGDYESGSGWPAPFGYLTALGLAYATSCAYFALRRWMVSTGALVVLALDVPIVTAIVHWTGGIESQFALVYLPLGLAAGVLRGVPAGFGIGVTAAIAYVAVLLAEAAGWLVPCGFGATAGRVLEPGGTDILRLISVSLVIVSTGLLAGLLGRALAERSRALCTASRRLARAHLDTAYVIEHLGSGLLSIDADGVILHFNRAAGRILGVDPMVVIGKRVTEALPAGAATFIDWLERARQGGAPLVRQEIELRREDDSVVPLGMSGSRTDPVDGEGGDLIAIFQDLTRAREEEAERVRQERLAVIGGMAAGIAHEIRNCVKPVSGSLDVLVRELELDGANRRLMELAMRECARLGHFVQAMLDYGRVTPLVLEPVRLDELVAEVVETLDVLGSAVAPHQVELRIEPEARGVTAAGDREQLKQVLLNLAMNGLEAMESRPGTLTFGLATEDLEAAVARPTEAGLAPAAAGPTPRVTLLTVSDTGPGMDAATAAQIFEPFFTTKRGGTGFGLAIAASIIERHGGEFTVKTAPGQGSRFEIRLGQEAVGATDAGARTA
ncbi:MAG: ATP-binding protein [Candidatus Eiseniibacteriota bacterium]|jgi:PAS domain S-box-containing protein